MARKEIAPTSREYRGGVVGAVCGRGGLVSVVVCGPLRWLLVVVEVTEQPGSWTSGRGFESHRGGLESV